MRKNSTLIKETRNESLPTAMPVESTPMEEAINSVSYQLTRLETSIETLIHNLGPILSSMEGETNECKDPSYSGNSIHVRNIHDLRYRVQSLINQVDFANERLEV